ncbi:MAG: YlxR family protein [Lachnospiraceae bacterium]|nr:YlxR family protein [Lachnospiraceae bacterium]
MENNKRETTRQCIGCRRIRPKAELIRVIRTPEGEAVLDFSGRKNGRGAYLCADDAACLVTAQKKKALERALKVPVSEEVFLRLREAYDHGQTT